MLKYLSLIICIAMVVHANADEQRLPEKTEDKKNLLVLGENHPRAFFFRQTESLPYREGVDYDTWKSMVSRLMGIIGKVELEELPHSSPVNKEFFLRFKQEYPEQLVLLHFNGNARCPGYETEEFFAGHWLYYNGAKILSDIPASGEETTIAVSDMLFSMTVGRYGKHPDQIGLCELDENGQPDWSKSEQVELVSLDAEKKTITVRRGCFGTAPRAFRSGKAYAAAHAVEGPWGPRNSTIHQLLWFYNFSTDCPRDSKGKNCVDVLTDELASKFVSGGELASFDGIQFDVLVHNDVKSPKRPWRLPDVNADGIADGGYFDKVNHYGIGVLEFGRQLRAKMGEDKLILADGWVPNNQRCFDSFNGIESEGWPHQADIAVDDWSGGLNRHFFWRQFAREPVFNYINHKYIWPSGIRGVPMVPEVPFKFHRLVFAGGVFTDSAICYAVAPIYPPHAPMTDRLPIWDELCRGEDQVIGWLGKARGEAVRLASETPNVYPNPKIQRTIDSEGDTKIVVPNVPLRGKNLFVAVTARCEPMPAPYPESMPRLMMAKLGGQQFMSWVGTESFTSYFFFTRSAEDETTDELVLTVEGTVPVNVENIAFHHAADIVYRQFENGVVLANPSNEPYTFDMKKLFPDKKFRRIQATPLQDVRVNNGRPVGAEVPLRARDALFLRKEE